MGAPGGPKSGGRKKGTPNKSTTARAEAMARVNEALAAIGEDTISGTRLLREVLNHADAPPEVKIQCAGLLQKHEQETATNTQYVAVMPLPVKDLDEWKGLYMEAKPDARLEDVAWHAKVACKVLEHEQKPITTKAPWLVDDKKYAPQGSATKGLGLCSTSAAAITGSRSSNAANSIRAAGVIQRPLKLSNMQSCIAGC